MNLFDRDRHPVRFAVLTSVTGGLSLAAILAASGALFRTGLLTAPVPVWSLLAVAAIAAGVVAAFGVISQRPAARTFLILPAFTENHWLATVVKHMHRSLDRRGKSVLLMIPDEDYSVEGQAHHLRNIEARRAECVGGFIVAADEKASRSDLRRFCAELGRPVVLMDVEPFDDEQDYPANAVYVGYAAADIGEMAASWALRRLAAAGETDPTILVVAGPAQWGRHRRFIEVMDSELGPGRVVLAEDGHFSRVQARTVVEQRLRELDGAGRKPAVIFCTNDEMALGAVDALLADGSELANTVAILGVDGTPEARALIDTRRSPLQATIVQDPYKISEKAADLFERMIKGERVRVRTRLPVGLYDGSGRR